VHDGETSGMKLKFERLTANVGARVQGFHNSAIVDPGVSTALRDALHRFKLLTFYLPHFSAGDQIRFAGLFGAVSRVVGVTRQRVYVEVRPEFLTMLVIGEDFGRFPADTGRDHKDPLMALLSSEGESPKSYTFRSWREKRRRASLQCVVAIPGSEDGKYFADIDIDLTNPLSDPWAFLGHLIDEPTDHLRL